MNDDRIANCTAVSRLLAPAKLNLGLSVVGRRQDGLHRLESLFWPVDLCDEIFLSPAETCEVTTEWAADAPTTGYPLPASEENIVLKALRALRDRGAPSQRARIVKRIPLGAGLGGGSSDAGAVLRKYIEPFGNTEAGIDVLAERLGADVPFFLDPRPTWVTGIGEKRERLEVAPELVRTLAFLLVVLPEPVETRAVFQRLRTKGGAFSPAKTPPNGGCIDGNRLRHFLGGVKNDLEDAASHHNPLISTVLGELRRTSCLYAGLSGSGSTCFAVFEDDRAREKNLQELASFFRGNNCRGIKAKTFTME